SGPGQASLWSADRPRVSPPFRFRLEQVLDHRSRREDLMRQELAQAMAAVAAQQERAVAAQGAVATALAALRSLMGAPIELDALRAGHHGLSLLRSRAAHERSTVEGLEVVADERRADLVRASQEREALVQLRRTALERHRVEAQRLEGLELDELAGRRA
ncbi:unnamed protein product, partial [Phaeothamnion confervicola]